jgi:DNA-binding protein HU-beta
MNKAEFIDYISKQQNCTKVEAEKIINAFTKAVTGVLSEEKTVELVGFGNFHTSFVAARTGRNPKTGEAMEIAAYTQPKFSVGKKLKDACNKKGTA